MYIKLKLIFQKCQVIFIFYNLFYYSLSSADLLFTVTDNLFLKDFHLKIYTIY